MSKKQTKKRERDDDDDDNNNNNNSRNVRAEHTIGAGAVVPPRRSLGAATTRTFGWLPDAPDLRDYDSRGGRVRAVFSAVNARNPVFDGLGAAAAESHVVKDNFNVIAIENQASLGSCTAQAGVAVLEYYVKLKYGRIENFSRLFLYKATRQMMGWSGDTGAFLRTTMQAMVAIGVPPEQHWPYAIEMFDDEPPAFCYALAQNFQALKYVKLDVVGDRLATLDSIKAYLRAAHPVMFGFSVYSSYVTAEASGDIPFPTNAEQRVGGHAVVAVGYDDARGVLLIRNSWGVEWGQQGYGTLPYAYVTLGLAQDFWCLLNNEWLDLAVFQNDMPSSSDATAERTIRPARALSARDQLQRDINDPAGSTTINCQAYGNIEIDKAVEINRSGVTLNGLVAHLKTNVKGEEILRVNANNVTINDAVLKGNNDYFGPINNGRATLLLIHADNCTVDGAIVAYSTREGVAVRPKQQGQIITGGAIKNVRGYFNSRDVVSISGMTGDGNQQNGKVVGIEVSRVLCIAKGGQQYLAAADRSAAQTDCARLGINLGQPSPNSMAIRSAVEVADVVKSIKVKKVRAYGFKNGSDDDCGAICIQIHLSSQVMEDVTVDDVFASHCHRVVFLQSPNNILLVVPPFVVRNVTADSCDEPFHQPPGSTH